jgi:hypothetical protein
MRSLSFARESLDEFHLLCAVRCSVVAKNFVKPDRRLSADVWTTPRIPRQVRLRVVSYPRVVVVWIDSAVMISTILDAKGFVSADRTGVYYDEIGEES